MSSRLLLALPLVAAGLLAGCGAPPAGPATLPQAATATAAPAPVSPTRPTGSPTAAASPSASAAASDNIKVAKPTAKQETKSPLVGFLMRLERPIDHRDADPVDPLAPKPQGGLHRVWFRAKGALPDDALTDDIVTISAGLAAYQPGHPYLSPQALMQAADEALYLAKHMGRDRLCLAS